MNKNINISAEVYFALKLHREVLQRLVNGGVDNWSGYSESLNPDGEETLEEFEFNLRKEILGEQNV